jgi:hypothetical protein
MHDRDDIPVETTEGSRGGNGMGDRLVVGLAAVALLGGALIVAAKGLGGNSGISSASRSPASTASASGSATSSSGPNPTQEAVAVLPQELPSPRPEDPQLFYGWIRANRDLPIHESTSTRSSRIGEIAKGALAYVEQVEGHPDGSDWFQSDFPGPNGFFEAGKDGAYIHRYQSIPGPFGGGINGVAGSREGFVAWGSSSGRAGTNQSPLLATSADGRAWRRVDYSPFGDVSIQSVGAGPAGWLALGSMQRNDDSIMWLWRSTDGRGWTSLGTLPTASGDRESRLIGSDAGYLILSADYRSQNDQVDSWFSVDGLTWTNGKLPPGIGLGAQHVLALRSGFYAWSDPRPDLANAGAAYSRDGLTWVALDRPPMAGNGQIVAMGDSMLAVDSSPVTGAPRVWRGILLNGQVSWTQQQAGLPRGLGIANLASDGRTAVLFGWDRESDEPRAWSLSGSSWAQMALPDGAFGGVVPSLTVGSSAGFVALGARMNLRADNPVFWSWNKAGGWAAESSPVIAPIGERTDLRCPARPADSAAFATLDVPAAVLCFGDKPMTFRTFYGQCDGCTGGSSDTYKPEWLADPNRNQLYLSPVESTDNWWFNARRGDGLAEDPAWTSQWVEVTGHFDDPASTQCRWVPDPHSPQAISSAQSTINSCRQQFVVTRIRVVSGP